MDNFHPVAIIRSTKEKQTCFDGLISNFNLRIFVMEKWQLLKIYTESLETIQEDGHLTFFIVYLITRTMKQKKNQILTKNLSVKPLHQITVKK